MKIRLKTDVKPLAPVGLLATGKEFEATKTPEGLYAITTELGVVYIQPAAVEEVALAVYTIAVDRTTLVAGETCTLTLAFTNVGGAWLVTNGVESSLDGSKQPVVLAKQPVQTTNYALRVLLPDGTKPEKKVTVTVTPPLGWKGEYFNNQTLTGTPVAMATHTALNFNWGAGAPAPGVTVDNWSARFTKTSSWNAGTYEWTITADDGVRLYVDDQLVIDGWKEQAATIYKGHKTLAAGGHVERVEFFEKGGNAQLSLSSELYTAPPPPPIPPLYPKGRLGFHGMTGGDSVWRAFDAGARFFLIMNNYELGNQLVARGATVMYREYWNHAPSVDELVGALHPSRFDPRIIRTGINENEFIDGSNIAWHAAFDKAVAEKLKAINPAVVYAAGSFSMGTPDFTSQQTCDAIRANYAPLYNSGLIWWDQHTYSPNMTWIHQVPAIRGALTPMYQKRVERPVGRDNHYATWTEPTSNSSMAFITALLSAFADTPTPQDWFETRWKFLFTRCGFDPRSPSRVVSGETGVDEGSVGGFSAHNATDQQVVDWCKRYNALSTAPITVNGIQYPSPFAGGAIFQLTDNVRWAGYEATRYIAAMKAQGVFL